MGCTPIRVRCLSSHRPRCIWRQRHIAAESESRISGYSRKRVLFWKGSFNSTHRPRAMLGPGGNSHEYSAGYGCPLARSETHTVKQLICCRTSHDSWRRWSESAIPGSQPLVGKNDSGRWRHLSPKEDVHGSSAIRIPLPRLANHKLRSDELEPVRGEPSPLASYLLPSHHHDIARRASRQIAAHRCLNVCYRPHPGCAPFPRGRDRFLGVAGQENPSLLGFCESGRQIHQTHNPHKGCAQFVGHIGFHGVSSISCTLHPCLLPKLFGQPPLMMTQSAIRKFR